MLCLRGCSASSVPANDVALSISPDATLWKSFSVDRGKFGSELGGEVCRVYVCARCFARRYTPTQSLHAEYLSSLSWGGNTWPIAMQIEKSKLKWMKNMPLVCSSSSICRVWCILSPPAGNTFKPHAPPVSAHEENLVEKRWTDVETSVWRHFSTTKSLHKGKDFRGKGLFLCWHVWVYVCFHNNRLYNPFHNSHPRFGAYIYCEGCLGRPTTK